MRTGARLTAALQFVFEFFDGNVGLLKNALKGLWSKSPMIGNRDLEGPMRKLNVPALLIFHFEAEPPQSLNRTRP